MDDSGRVVIWSSKDVTDPASIALSDGVEEAQLTGPLVELLT